MVGYATVMVSKSLTKFLEGDILGRDSTQERRVAPKQSEDVNRMFALTPDSFICAFTRVDETIPCLTSPTHLHFYIDHMRPQVVCLPSPLLDRFFCFLYSQLHGFPILHAVNIPTAIKTYGNLDTLA
jgi:hypothetical protein